MSTSPSLGECLLKDVPRINTDALELGLWPRAMISNGRGAQPHSCNPQYLPILPLPACKWRQFHPRISRRSSKKLNLSPRRVSKPRTLRDI